MATKTLKDGTTVTTKSVYETGHGKNVANFSTFIKAVRGMGAKYQPSNDLITLPNLEVKEKRIAQHMEAWAKEDRSFKNTEIARRQAFANIKKYATRLVATLASSAKVSQLTLDDATSINKKIQGVRATKKKDEATAEAITPPAKNISASQQSYDMLIEHFRKLRVLLESVPTYTPHEDDLNMKAIHTYEQLLKNTNDDAATAENAIVDNRNARNFELYNEETGLVALSKLMKLYLKSKSTTNPDYLKIKGLSFRTIADKGSALK